MRPPPRYQRAKRSVSLTLCSTGLAGKATGAKPTLQTALRHVLWAESRKDDGNVVRVSTLANKKKHLVLVTINAHVAATDEEADEWVKKINEMAYDGPFALIMLTLMNLTSHLAHFCQALLLDVN